MHGNTSINFDGTYARAQYKVALTRKERVWYIASRVPSDTPLGSQLSFFRTKRHNIYNTTFSGLSGFPIGAADAL